MAQHIRRLHHVGVFVQDLDASIAWYRDYLGFEHEYDFALPGASVIMLVRGEAHLELYRVEDAAPVAPERLEVETILKAGGINHLAFLVEDVDAAVADLAAKPSSGTMNGCLSSWCNPQDNLPVRRSRS